MNTSNHDDTNAQPSGWAPPAGSVPPPPEPAAPATPGVPSLPPVGAPALPPTPPSATPPPSASPVAGPPTVGVAGTPPSGSLGATGELTFDQPEPTGRKRGRRAVAGIAAGVVVLGAAGVFAAGQLRGGNTGGAESPEEVGTAMMSALEQEDVLGMVDLLLPGERETFRQPMIDVVSELSRLEVLSPDASLGDLGGLDIEMTGEQTTVTPTNVDDISNIVMRAELTATLDGSQLPIGDLVTDLAGEGFDPSSLSEEAVTTPFELPMAVVEEDGRWYLSVFHTAAESVRSSLGQSEDIPAVGLTPRGGDTPEGAVLALLDGVEQLDVGKIIASINPNEAQALQRYAPLFLDDVEPVLDEIPLTWQVTNTEFTVVGDGSKRFVSVNALRIDGDIEGESFAISIDGDCAVLEAAGERFDSCELAQEQSSLDDLLGSTSDSITELTNEFESVFADYERPGITVQEVDGTWYVSPIGAGFDQTLALLRSLDRSEIDQLIETTTSVVDDVLGDVFGDGSGGFPLPGLDDGDVISVPFPEDIVDGGEDTSTDEPLFDEDFDEDFDEEFDDFDAEQAILNECYALGETQPIIDCLTTNVESGALPAFYLTPALEYPECGVADLALGNVLLSELSDAEFTSIVENASVCFGELIEAGTVSEFDVSAEFLRPECAEGRNPWNFESDDGGDFFDEWLSCIYG